MKKTVTPTRRRTREHPPKPAPKKPTSVDEQLAEHLKQAEHHLIAAVELFLGEEKPQRRVGYQGRLTQAQEAITTLYAEELVRIRGPQRPERKKKAK